MNGPRIPVIHNRAFGHASILTPARAGVRTPAPHLGAPPGPTISDAELRYREATTHYEGVRKTYPNLIRLIGESDANAALEEAKRAYEHALAEFTAQQPTRL